MKHCPIKEGAACPDCDGGRLVRTVQAEPFEYAGEHFVLEEVASYTCPVCGEGTFAPEEARLLEKRLTDARRRIDGLLTSEEIRTLRKSFDLTQVEFARLFKVGEKNFARYETGQSTQERGMDWALRMLRANPAMIEILAAAEDGPMAQPLSEAAPPAA